MAQITLNSTGVASNGSLVLQSNGTTAAVTIDTSQRVAFVAGTAALPAITTTGDTNTGIFFPAADTVAIATGGTEIARIDSSGNLGLGVTPSATWNSAFKVTEIKGAGNAFFAGGSGWTLMSSNAFYGASNWQYGATGNLATAYEQFNGTHVFKIAPNNAGAAGATCNFTNAMTLDSSGNLLVGTTSGTNHIIYKNAAVAARIIAFQGENSGAYTSVAWATADNQGWNGANTVQIIGKNTGTGRSINAAGTINASGADYAEYMTKAGNFTVAKGDVVGINAQGKLTNVFANAISFVVKSTDPSYVGGDSWGVGFEDDAVGLEAARQLVDRIAFAGQVPVNVTGATAGQYIIPVNDNGAIKGEAVSNPTFEQYQTAVGKVIAIESDGRARIIVKVA